MAVVSAKGNPEELKRLAEDLDDFVSDNRDILGRNPTILHPLDQAQKEAHRRWNILKPEVKE